MITYLYPALNEDETDACTNWTFNTPTTNNTTGDLLTVNDATAPSWEGHADPYRQPLNLVVPYNGPSGVGPDLYYNTIFEVGAQGQDNGQVLISLVSEVTQKNPYTLIWVQPKQFLK